MIARLLLLLLPSPWAAAASDDAETDRAPAASDDDGAATDDYGDPPVRSAAPPLDRRSRRAAGERRVAVPPLRVDTGIAIREDLGAGGVFQVGVQLTRSARWTLDADAAVVSGRGIRYPGPFRSMISWELRAEALYNPGRWLAVGPTAGGSYRLYRQQFTAIDEGFVPFVGLQANTAVIRARKWSLALTSRLTADLALTRFVLETAEVVTLPVVDGQLG
ncbi:MAG: hypothetical protein ABMB14_40590, partial [Myxococcota bacterium]